MQLTTLDKAKIIVFYVEGDGLVSEDIALLLKQLLVIHIYIIIIL